MNGYGTEVAAAAMTVAEVVSVLPIGGVTPLTTVDFPNRLSLVVFTQGCPWRCPYCHNRLFQKVGRSGEWTWTRVRKLLEPRRGFLEAVVFSGGEPTLHGSTLLSAMQEVREMGFLTGLHTAGVYPERLASLLPWLDWVGLDIKAPFDHRYTRLTGDPQSCAKVMQSLQLLQTSGVAFQLRTTMGEGALSEADFDLVKLQLRKMDAPESVCQKVQLVGGDTLTQMI